MTCPEESILFFSFQFLLKFPSVRGGGGIKLYSIGNSVYEATHIYSSNLQRPPIMPNYSDLVFVASGPALYLDSISYLPKECRILFGRTLTSNLSLLVDDDEEILKYLHI